MKRPARERLRLRLPALVLCVLFLFMSNLPSVFFQTAGWTWMLFKFSQQGTVSQAVEKTFSGKNPCSMCKLSEAVKVNRDSQDSDTLTQPEPGWRFACVPPRPIRLLPVVPPAYSLLRLETRSIRPLSSRPTERPG